MIAQPEHLNIQLYPHQKVSVFEMEKLERQQRVYIDTYHCSSETNFGILGDIPGYGKSYSVVSLILRDQMEWDVNREYIKNNINVLNESIKLIYTINKKPVKTNLIVCSISIMKKWKEYFNRAPSLSVYEISSEKHMNDFELGKHDIIIISSTKYNNFINLVGDNIIWKRFIMDEAAHLNIPKMKKVYFGFMWLITSSYNFLHSIKGNGHHFLFNFMRLIPYDILCYYVIKNEDNFIKQSFVLPSINNIFHKCLNPRILRILRNHIDEETQTMISAGNIKGAISKLGGNIYSTTNLIDIVKKRKEEKITNCLYSIDFWKKRENEKEVKQWEERLKLCMNEINDLDEKYQNMLKDDCSICYDSVSEPTMVSCCQNIFCGKCIIKWLQMNHNTCPLCRQLIKTTDLSFIGNDEKEEKIEKPKTKKEIVIDIIKSCIENNRKVILFSSYDETFEIIRNDLDENKIDFAELSGNRYTRESKLDKFISGRINVIFLNSRFNGAGINLQVTDDIILYHKMSESLLTQVTGRALRIGRTNKLNIHHFNDE